MATKKAGARRAGIGKKPAITVRDILRTVLTFVRTDYGGGQNFQTVIPERLKEAGIPVSKDTVDAYRLGADRTRDTIRNYLTPQVQTLRDIIGL